ncbi:hypothetical protein I3843_11G068200 [Carya illinoinensis]|uniref:Uncharacterized protein n=1 Tax=Carya illinoinensis TaxID=32201 RepID=A0A922DMN9_CARIL|nr:hypothetical protein I3760_11G068400 [Carya illinoinensis]KAG6687385.1 hypothetical protein I3842_11G068600 [Carya illinoinensis]KAG7955377.1 hypothetical protein I3843_11G068200 [Carya illinoinensis]
MAATMAMLNAKCLITSSNKMAANPTKPASYTKPNTLLSIQNLTKGLTSKSVESLNFSTSLTSSAIAGAIFSTLTVAWVLFNILQPALNQINRMRSNQGLIVGLGLGLGGLAASGFMSTPHASAGEIAMIAEAAPTSDSRGQLLLIVVAPAILWVIYNILQPALNQINKMRSE